MLARLSPPLYRSRTADVFPLTHSPTHAARPTATGRTLPTHPSIVRLAALLHPLCLIILLARPCGHLQLSRLATSPTVETNGIRQTCNSAGFSLVFSVDYSASTYYYGCFCFPLARLWPRHIRREPKANHPQGVEISRLPLSSLLLPLCKLP